MRQLSNDQKTEISCPGQSTGGDHTQTQPHCMCYKRERGGEGGLRKVMNGATTDAQNSSGSDT